MKTKIHIAVLLTIIFLAKFLVVDAHGLNMVFSGSDITFVNPHCKKENSINKSDETSNFSQQDIVDAHMVTLNGPCSTPFQFEFFSWDIVCLDLIAFFNDHLPSNLSYRFLDNVSPPPRLA